MTSTRDLNLKVDYLQDVRKFAGPKPFTDSDGTRTYLSHKVNFNPGQLVTDGAGNVTDMPLLRSKPCFGRPEFWYSPHQEPKTFKAADGEAFVQDTACLRCDAKAPGVAAACDQLVAERVASCPGLEHLLNELAPIQDDPRGGSLRAQRLRTKWGRIVGLIEAHGGWSNVNDDRVRADDRRRHEERNKQRNAQRREKTKANRRARSGRTLAPDLLQKLDDEASVRAGILENIRGSSNAPRWITKMTDETIKRTVDVWRVKQLIQFEGDDPSGTNIADQLIRQGADWGLPRASMIARCCERLRKIERLESDVGSEPLWRRFTP